MGLFAVCLLDVPYGMHSRLAPAGAVLLLLCYWDWNARARLDSLLSVVHRTGPEPKIWAASPGT
jgi:hypothetical protein